MTCGMSISVHYKSDLELTTTSRNGNVVFNPSLVPAIQTSGLSLESWKGNSHFIIFNWHRYLLVMWFLNERNTKMQQSVYFTYFRTMVTVMCWTFFVVLLTIFTCKDFGQYTLVLDNNCSALWTSNLFVLM